MKNGEGEDKIKEDKKVREYERTAEAWFQGSEMM